MQTARFGQRFPVPSAAPGHSPTPTLRDSTAQSGRSRFTEFVIRASRVEVKTFSGKRRPRSLPRSLPGLVVPDHGTPFFQ